MPWGWVAEFGGQGEAEEPEQPHRRLADEGFELGKDDVLQVAVVVVARRELAVPRVHGVSRVHSRQRPVAQLA